MKYYFIDDAHYPSKFGEEDLKQLKRQGLNCHLASKAELAEEKTNTEFEEGRSIVVELNTIDDLSRLQKSWGTYIWLDPKHHTAIPTPYLPD